MQNHNTSVTEREDSLNTKTEDTSNINIQDTPVTTANEYLKNVIPGSLVDNVLYYIPSNLHYKFKDVLSLFIKNEISKDFLYYAEHIQYNANELIMDTPLEEMNICEECRESMDIIQFPE
jgi:hypothetical protein